MKDMERLLRALEDVDEDIDFKNEKNMINNGVIDSLKLTQIIASLDDAFDIHIKMGDIEPENFEDIESMLKLVKKYQGCHFA